MAVAAGLEPVAVEDRPERRDVLAEPLGRDRRVLHERDRPPRALAGRHQQAEAGLADLGQRVLLGRRLGAQVVVAVAVLAPGRLEPVELARLASLAEERDVEQRARVALDARSAISAYSCLERDSSRIVASIISTAAGSSASASSVAAIASSTDSKWPTANCRAVGQLDQADGRLGDRHERALEPVTSLARSNPRARRSSR